MSVPHVYKIVREAPGVDDDEILTITQSSAQAALAHYTNPENAVMPSGDPVEWVTLFQLEDDGWVLAGIEPIPNGGTL
jgi:hypothetical protein